MNQDEIDYQDYQDYLDYQNYLQSQPNQDFFSAQTAKNVGQALTRGVAGLGDLGAMAGSSVMNTLIPGLTGAGDTIKSALGINQPTLTQISDNTIGTPSPRSDLERYALKGVEAVPGMALGGEASLMSLLANFSGGAGSEVAKDMGVNPIWGALLGSFAPQAAATGMKAIAAPFTAGGREVIAGNLLKDAAGPEGIQNLIQDTGYAPYGAKTFAEIAQTPGAANLQMSLGKELEGSATNTIMKALTERQEAREAALKDVAPTALEGITPDVRGSDIRAPALEETLANSRQVDDIWRSVSNLDQKFDYSKAIKPVTELENELRTPLGFSRDANTILDVFKGTKETPATFMKVVDKEGQPIQLSGATSKGLITIDDYKKLRSAAGQVFADASKDGRMTEAKLMGTIKDKLDEAAYSATASGKITGDTVSKLRNAIDATRNYKTTYDSGVPGEIISKGELGFSARESQIPQKVLANPESAKQFMKAYGENPEAVKQAKAALIDKITAKDDPTTWMKQFDNNRPQLKAIFREDFLKVKQVIDDLTSEKSVGKLAQQATGRGSITSQAISAAKFISNPRNLLGVLKSSQALGIGGSSALTSGLVSGNLLLAGAAIPVAAIIKHVATKSDSEIRAALVKAMVDPEFARTAIKTATEANVTDLAQRLLPYVGPSSVALSPQGHTPSTQSPSYPETQPPEASQERQYSSPSSLDGQLMNSVNPAFQPGISQIRKFEAQPREEPTQSQQQQRNISVPSPNSATTPDLSQPRKEKVAALIKRQTPLIQAQILVESGGNPKAVSPKGATGLMQLMPSTAKWLKVNHLDDEDNVTGGKKFMTYLNKKYHDNLLALAAYNAGEGKVDAAIRKADKLGLPTDFFSIRQFLPQETQDYPIKVARVYQQITGVS